MTTSQNMSLSETDKEMLTSYTNGLLERRKQMAPCPLVKPEHIERLYMTAQSVAAMQVFIDAAPVNESLFYKDNTVTVAASNIAAGVGPVEVFFRVKEPFKQPQGRYNGSVLLLESSPYYDAFRAWLLRALKVETLNMITTFVVRQTIRQATTYKQLFKALPQSMEAVSAYSGTVNSWTYNRPRDKLRKVLEINRAEGAGRARSLPPEVVAMLKRRQHIVEECLAGAVILPELEGRRARTPDYNGTWPSNYRIDTTLI